MKTQIETATINSDALLLLFKSQNIDELIKNMTKAESVNLYQAVGPIGLHPDTEETYTCISMKGNNSRDIITDFVNWVYNKYYGKKQIDIFLYLIRFNLIPKGTNIVEKNFDIVSNTVVEKDYVTTLIRFGILSKDYEEINTNQ